jgi:hypothetical protein
MAYPLPFRANPKASAGTKKASADDMSMKAFDSAQEIRFRATVS